MLTSFRHKAMDPRKAFVTFLALLGALILLYWLLSSVVAFAYRGSINISRSDLENARNKWRGQNITQYDMTYDIKPVSGHICHSCGTYKLRISDNRVTIFDYSTKTLSLPYSPDDYRVTSGQLDESAPVDRMFQEIDEWLTGRCFACDDVVPRLYFDYKVHFDPQLGFPTSMSMVAGGGGSRQYGSYDIEIRDLKPVR